MPTCYKVAAQQQLEQQLSLQLHLLTIQSQVQLKYQLHQGNESFSVFIIIYTTIYKLKF